MDKNKKSADSEKKAERKKALWWSLLWSNVAMLVVLLLTFLFQNYLYTQLISANKPVDIEINPLIVGLGYIVGMLILWAIIYKYETKEDDLFDQNDNHNIY